MNEFQRLSRRTIPDTRATRDLLANFALGLCGEAGEVSEPIKKHLFHGKDLDLDALSGELGDVLFYLAGLCSVLGVQLSDVAEANVRKLQARHPNGFNPSQPDWLSPKACSCPVCGPAGLSACVGHAEPECTGTETRGAGYEITLCDAANPCQRHECSAHDCLCTVAE